MWASIVFFYHLIRFDSIRYPFRCRFWCSMTLNLRYRYWESDVLMLMPNLDQRIFVLPMSILMFIDFESLISVLGIWETHVCLKSFVFNVLINLSFLLCIWISPFSHLRGLLFCLMILYSICYKTNHFLATSGLAHFQASKQAYAMWASIVFVIIWIDLITQLWTTQLWTTQL